LWWPTSREWFVSTEVDFWVTLIGASDELASQLLESRELNTTEVLWESELVDVGDGPNHDGYI
jgi:hypothetical protein